MSTQGHRTVSRHQKYLSSRETHSSGGWDPAAPIHDEYGGVIQGEQIGAWQIPPGSVNGGNIDPGGLPGDTITAGTLPASAYDNVAPAVPTDLAATSDALSPEGRFGVRLHVTLAHPGDDDYFGSYIEVTRDVDEDQEPDWSSSMVQLLGAENASVTFDGVLPSTTYYVRARAVDVQGNLSAYTAAIEIETARDGDAPGIPTGLTVTAGFRGLGVFWERSSTRDLAFYDLRYRPTGGSTWTYLRLRVTAHFLPNLTPDVEYEVQVRAVDTSNNVEDNSGAEPVAVDATDFPEAGWTVSATGTPNLVGSVDIAAGAIVAEHINVGALDAGHIGTGSLRITTTVGEGADALEIYLGEELVGQWDENGIVIYDQDDPDRLVRLNDGALEFSTDGGDTFQMAVGPEGVSASAIRLGRLPGGYNLVFNSGFELSAYAVQGQAEWNVATDWSGTRVGSLTNITEGTSLTLTTATY